MTIVDASLRFEHRRMAAQLDRALTDVEGWCEARGMEPWVIYRSGAQMGLTECGVVAPFLMRVIDTAEAACPAVVAAWGLWWDNRTGTSGTLLWDAAHLQCYPTLAPPPAALEIEVDGAHVRLTFEAGPIPDFLASHSGEGA